MCVVCMYILMLVMLVFRSLQLHNLTPLILTPTVCSLDRTFRPPTHKCVMMTQHIDAAAGTDNMVCFKAIEEARALEADEKGEKLIKGSGGFASFKRIHTSLKKVRQSSSLLHLNSNGRTSSRMQKGKKGGSDFASAETAMAESLKTATDTANIAAVATKEAAETVEAAKKGGNPDTVKKATEKLESAKSAEAAAEAEAEAEVESKAEEDADAAEDKETDEPSETTFTRLVGKKTEYIRVYCPADKVCEVPSKVAILYPQEKKRKTSVKVEKLVDEVNQAIARDSGGTIPNFERPTFRVTFRDQTTIDVRLTSGSTLLVFNQVTSAGEAELPEVYIIRFKKDDSVDPSRMISITQQLLDLYQVTLEDTARGSDDVFDSGPVATYAFASAIADWKRSLIRAPEYLSKYGYEDEHGEDQDATDAEISLIRHLPPALCDGFTELQWWAAAVEEVFITSPSANVREGRVNELFKAGSPDTLPGYWQLPSNVDPCGDTGKYVAGGPKNVRALRDPGMLAPGETHFASRLVEAFEAGATIESLLTAPLQGVNSALRLKHPMTQHKAPVDDLGGGLISAFLEGIWDEKKQAVGQFRDNMVGHAKNVHTSMKTDNGRKGLIQGFKNHMIKDQKKFDNSNPFGPKKAKKDGDQFSTSMSYDDWKRGPGKGRKNVAYLNMDIARRHDKKHREYMAANNGAFGLGRFGKDAKKLRHELAELRDPMKGMVVDFEKAATWNVKQGKASNVKVGVTVKKGAVKAGIIVTGSAKIADMIRGKGMPDPTATVQGFVSVDKILKDGSKITTGMFVTRTVGVKLGEGKAELTDKTEVRGDLTYKSKDGWSVGAQAGVTTEKGGKKTGKINVKFKDTNAFGINGLCVDANIGFTCHKGADGSVTFDKEVKRKFKVTWNPSFQPKWLKDMRTFKEKGVTSFTTFKDKGSSTFEQYHKKSYEMKKMRGKWGGVGLQAGIGG